MLMMTFTYCPIQEKKKSLCFTYHPIQEKKKKNVCVDSNSVHAFGSAWETLSLTIRPGLGLGLQ